MHGRAKTSPGQLPEVADVAPSASAFPGGAPNPSVPSQTTRGGGEQGRVSREESAREVGGREAGSREAGGPEARAYEESAYEGTGPEGTCGPGRGPGAGREARRPGRAGP